MPAGWEGAGGIPVLSDRERLGEAVIDLVLERGYGEVTLEDLLQRAEVTPEVFAREFASLEDCVLGTVDDGVERFRRVVFGAYEGHEDWRDGMRAAGYVAARWIRDHTRYIVFATMMMNQATELARAHRDMALQMFAEIVDAGRQELDDPSSVSPETAMTVIGSIYELLQRELSKGHGTARAEDFVPELMYVAVRPYLGHAEALKELSIPPPEDVA
ncbi:MAG: TetR/AcrR family transcriptional regulator [Solirubrobacterales bacterium]